MNTSSKLLVAVTCLIAPTNAAKRAGTGLRGGRTSRYDISTKFRNLQTDQEYKYAIEWRCAVPQRGKLITIPKPGNPKITKKQRIQNENMDNFEQNAHWSRLRQNAKDDSLKTVRRHLKQIPRCHAYEKMTLHNEIEFRRAGHRNIVLPQYYGEIERNQVKAFHLQSCAISGDFSALDRYCERQWEKQPNHLSRKFKSIRNKLWKIEYSRTPGSGVYHLHHKPKKADELVWIYRIAEIYHGPIERMSARDAPYQDAWKDYTAETQGFDRDDNWSIRRLLRKVPPMGTSWDEEWRVFKNWAYRKVERHETEGVVNKAKPRKSKTIVIEFEESKANDEEVQDPAPSQRKNSSANSPAGDAEGQMQLDCYPQPQRYEDDLDDFKAPEADLHLYDDEWDGYKGGEPDSPVDDAVHREDANDSVSSQRLLVEEGQPRDMDGAEGIIRSHLTLQEHMIDSVPQKKSTPAHEDSCVPAPVPAAPIRGSQHKESDEKESLN